MTEDALDRIRPEHDLRLDELVRELGAGATLEGVEGADGGAAVSVLVTGVHHDSRRVQRGDLFVARKGAGADGAKYVQDARNRGARAILAQSGTLRAADVGLPVVSVRNVMEGLALASAAVYGHPSFGLEVVGITGTNGKTTTTHLLRTAIDAACGRPRCGLIGTIAHAFGSLHIEAAHTTPEADDLARLMLAMKREGATHVAMEVSSIALAAGRTRAVRFTVAALTNLTQDHLDYHGTMRAYADAKSKLFLEYGPGTSVVCVDHALGRELAAKISGPVVRVSAYVAKEGDELAADVRPTRLHLSARGIAGEVQTPEGTFALRSPLVGAHNVENLVVVLGCISALGLDTNLALAALASDVGAPGRLERCDEPGDDISVVVDYAHTPDALARALDALRALSPASGKGRVVCVFGCGGDRDAQKRGPMGEAVAARANVVLVTSDNPRSEDPAAIAKPVAEAVAASMPRIGSAQIPNERGYLVELDRGKAIAMAIANAAPGDIVLVAGKGHEDYQIVGTDKRHFDDREHARAALEERRRPRSERPQ